MEMQKMRRHISAVTGRIFFIGFSVQIVLGLLWMMRNVTGMQHFVGAGMRLVLAFVANYILLSSVLVHTKKSSVFSVWGSLALLTYPLAMQCHVLAAGDSVTASITLLILAFAARVLHRFGQNKSGNVRRYVALVFACVPDLGNRGCKRCKGSITRTLSEFRINDG